MKKYLLVVGVGLLGIAIPIAGLTITPTRDFILGLAPDEAILKLADRIDENRLDYANKNQELQQTIDNQQAEMKKMQETIGGKANDLDTLSEQVKTTNSAIQGQNNCLKANELYTQIPKKPSGACSTMGPNNIVDMYKAIKRNYEEYKNDDETRSGNGDLAKDCFKKYLVILEPAYNKYLEAKKLCP